METAPDLPTENPYRCTYATFAIP